MSGRANWLAATAAARAKLGRNKPLNTCMLIGRHKQLNKLGVVAKTGHGLRPPMLFPLVLQSVEAQHTNARTTISVGDMQLTIWWMHY
jgi:hypothetical protein